MRPPGMSLPKDSRGLLRGASRRRARAAEMPHALVRHNERFEGRVRVEVRGHPRPHLDQVEGLGGVGKGGGGAAAKDSAAFRSHTDPPSAWGST
jgi:hypothetical protein